jgi:hypothetical protein
MNDPAASSGVSSSLLCRHSVLLTESSRVFWIPAFAGMTNSPQAAGNTTLREFKHKERRHDMRKSMMLLLVAVVFVFATNSFVRGAEVIKLKGANYLPVAHPMSLLSGWFCDEVKKRTNGRVEITYYPGGTLLNPLNWCHDKQYAKCVKGELRKEGEKSFLKMFYMIT